ncbi:metabotropic glutamate receptor 5 [Lingula anatina]|uniref:Metabotropic glutamate receptor 5 n=1 Tax=Lingula anatina TaxID=7574 RepID=A0A2R2MRZ1_LINAN|nr:metabotropic glutamate receptor 5 [Lingula anatina]|eukprot:XP_023932767.1 metabotropic glutamate receptor 5 [Lingula anatina]
MIDIILYHGWSYISAIHEEGNYGETALKTFRRYAKAFGICIAVDAQLSLSSTEEDNDQVVRNLVNHKNAHVVVVFSGPAVALQLFKAVERAGITRMFQWIGSEAWGTRINSLVEVLDVVAGAITVQVSWRYVPDFDRYFTSLQLGDKPGNPWFEEFWEMQFGCSWKDGATRPCDETDTVSKSATYKPIKNISPVIDSVTTFAYALHDVIEKRCPGATGKGARDCISGPHLLESLKNITFEGVLGKIAFDENGDFLGQYDLVQLIDVRGPNYKQVKLATWDATLNGLIFDGKPIKWNLDDSDPANQTVPESVCAKPCRPGEFYIPKELKCCWECRHCRDNEITINNASTCLACPIFQWPEQSTFTSCEPIAAEHVRWGDPLAIGIVIVALLGLLATVATSVFYIRFNKERLIKASSRELSFLMLIGILLGYVTAIIFLATPKDYLCYCEYLGFSLSFSWLYAPLATRTNRIYRIFNTGKKSTIRPKFISPRSQVTIATIFITVQVIISIITAIVVPPTAELSMPVKTERFVELYCNIPIEGLIAFLTYNLCLIVVCSVHAFKTRKLPDNFNESRFISMTVYTTLVIWLAFIPTYFTTGKAYYKVILLACALIINDTVALSFLFLPKVYAVLYVDQDTLKMTSTNPGASVSGVNATKSTQHQVHPQPATVHDTLDPYRINSPVPGTSAMDGEMERPAGYYGPEAVLTPVQDLVARDSVVQ